MALKVLLVDDHKLFREGLRRVLEMEVDFAVAGEASTGEQAVHMAEQVACDLVIMDISMPELCGLEATRRIKAKCPELPVLVLSVCDDRDCLLEVFRAGASGYLLKDVEPVKLLDAIRAIARGGTVVDPRLAGQLVQELERLNRTLSNVAGHDLTAREIEILGLMAKGMNNATIARQAFISERTVKNHVTSILRKLEVDDRTKAVIVGVRRGLVAIE